MPYTEQTWTDGSVAPPAGGVSAARLRHIEQGITGATVTAEQALVDAASAASSAGLADVYDPRTFGAKFDALRVNATSVTGTAVVGTGFVKTAGPIVGDEGKVVYVEGGGAAVTLTDWSVDPTQPSSRNLWAVSPTANLSAADCGSVIRLPGVGAAGADLITVIRAVVDSRTAILRDAPTIAGSGLTGTYYRYHRTTVASVTDATHLTLSAAVTSTPLTQTGESGPGIFYATDNATAFNAMVAQMATDIVRVAVPLIGRTARRSAKRVYLPPGTAYTSETNLFPAVTQTTQGFTIEGQGSATSVIVYGPVATGQYLMSDPPSTGGAQWSRIALRMFGVEFIGHSLPGLYHSHSLGAQQGHHIEDVQVTGCAAGDIFNCDGADTNDKWFFDNFQLQVSCFANFFHIPTTGSQQQLHHQVVGGFWEWMVGNLFNMETGGNINFNAYAVLTGAGTVFKCGGLTTNDPSARTLHVAGTRVELRQSGCLLYDIQWANGAITFDNVTAAIPVTQAGGTAATDILGRLTEPSGGGSFPQFTARNCRFKGRHEVQYYGNGGVGNVKRRRIRYIDTSFQDWTYPEEPFVFTQLDSGTSVSGAIPPVDLEGCRGNDTTTPNPSDIAWDTTLNWQAAVSLHVREKTFKIANSRGKLPSAATLSRYLPLGSFLVGAHLYVDAGAATVAMTGGVFTLQTAETVPTVLATFRADGDDMRNGIDVQVDARKILDTALKRQLNLVANASVASEVAGFLIVRYI